MNRCSVLFVIQSILLSLQSAPYMTRRESITHLVRCILLTRFRLTKQTEKPENAHSLIGRRNELRKYTVVQLCGKRLNLSRVIQWGNYWKQNFAQYKITKTVKCRPAGKITDLNHFRTHPDFHTLLFPNIPTKFRYMVDENLVFSCAIFTF